MQLRNFSTSENIIYINNIYILMLVTYMLETKFYKYYSLAEEKFKAYWDMPGF